MTEQAAPEKVLEPCHVAGHGCFNPWGWGGPYGIIGNDNLIAIPLCYRCGDACCEGENCSSVVEYMGKDRRLCMTCLDEMAREQAILMTLTPDQKGAVDLDECPTRSCHCGLCAVCLA